MLADKKITNNISPELIRKMDRDITLFTKKTGDRKGEVSPIGKCLQKLKEIMLTEKDYMFHILSVKKEMDKVYSHHNMNMALNRTFKNIQDTLYYSCPKCGKREYVWDSEEIRGEEYFLCRVFSEKNIDKDLRNGCGYSEYKELYDNEDEELPY